MPSTFVMEDTPLLQSMRHQKKIGALTVSEESLILRTFSYFCFQKNEKEEAICVLLTKDQKEQVVNRLKDFSSKNSKLLESIRQIDSSDNR